MKEKTRRFRLTESQDRKLEELADEAGFGVSQYIRRELGLEGGGFGEVQPEGEDLGRPTPRAAPPAPAIVNSDKRFTRLVKQLEAQGNPDAEEVARKRLGL